MTRRDVAKKARKKLHKSADALVLQARALVTEAAENVNAGNITRRDAEELVLDVLQRLGALK